MYTIRVSNTAVDSNHQRRLENIYIFGKDITGHLTVKARKYFHKLPIYNRPYGLARLGFCRNIKLRSTNTVLQILHYEERSSLAQLVLHVPLHIYILGKWAYFRGCY